MDIIDLFNTLEQKLTREVVATKTGNTCISYTHNTPFTATINNTAHSEVNRICIIPTNTTTYVYLTSYAEERYVRRTEKLTLPSISTITITT